MAAAPSPPLTLAQAQARVRQLEQELAAALAAPPPAQLRRLAGIPDDNPHPILCFGSGAELLYANPAARHLQGQLPAGAALALRTQLAEAAGRSLREGQPLEMAVALAEAGADYHFQVFAVPRAAEASATIYLADVSGYHQAQRAQQQQRQFYEAILHELPAEVFALDPQERFLFLNPGIVPDAELRHWLRGRSGADYHARRGLPPALAAQRQAHFRAALATCQRQEWVEELGTPAQPRYLLRRLQPVPATGEAVRFVIGYGLDITTQELAQRALREQQEFTQSILEASPSVIYVRDAQANILFENRAMLAIRAQAPHFAEAPPAPDSAAAREMAEYAANDQQVLRTGRELTVEETLTLRDGTVRVFQTVKRPLPRPDGTVQILGVSTDITSRVRAEQAQRLAREEAEATALARENFLANMSHEIRTPMNGVLGMTAQLARTRLDPRQQELVRIIRTSGNHLLAVLNDVLDMAKISAGRLELEQLPFSLPEAVDAALEPLATQAREKGLTFALPTATTLPWVVGDPHRLNQILLNLVSNAVKFTSGGGGVAVEREVVADTPAALRLRFAVRDTGPGIAPSQQARIFESFTQAYAGTTRQHGGTGLGLSIARALVERMGGTLLLSSTLGEGSTFAFTLTLPKAPPAAHVGAAPDGPAAYDTGQLRGKRVLVVEDNDINRTVARMLLEPWGVQLDEAVDGYEALARLTAAPPYDVVLMDIQMPGLSGLDVTRHLRALPDRARAATPVIALTANAFRADAERYLAAGFHDCLTKPYDEAELYRCLVARLPAPAPPYSLAGLRRQALGREAFVHQIIRSFLSTMPARLDQLRGAAAAADWTEVARLAHYVRPNLAALGIGPAAEAAAVLAALAEGHCAPPPAAWQPALAQLLAATGLALAALPAELPAAAAGPA